MVFGYCIFAMDRIVKIFISTTLVFLFLSAALYASIHNHEAQAKILSREGLYDQALQEYGWAELKTNFTHKYLRIYGHTNAFLSLLTLALFLFRKKLKLQATSEVKIIRRIPPYFEK